MQQQKKKQRQPLSLKARALAWLAQREHSRSELRRKLLRVVAAAERAAAMQGQQTQEGIPSDPSAGSDASSMEAPFLAATDAAGSAAGKATEIDTLLDWLEAHKYLSEARFVEGRLRARAARYGNLRIRQEMAQHGVEVDAETEQALRASELSRAHEVWRRKFGGEATRDPSERAKQMRFLAGRGFSADVVRRVVRGERDEEFGDGESS